MITCPKCKNTLPDWTQVCQFCQSDVSKLARPVQPQDRAIRGSSNTAAWIWPTYYFISTYFILIGIWHIFDIVLLLHAINADATKHGLPGSSTMSFVIVPIIFDIILGAIPIVLGIGLIFKIEIIRGVTNFLCFLNIAVDLVMLVGNVLSAPIAGMVGGADLVMFGMFLQVTNLCFNGLMIYLIGETD